MYLDHSVAAFGTIPIVLGAILVSWTIYTLGVAVYNVTFHPLAKYPGPKLHAAFWLPDSLSSMRGTNHADTRKLHETYGQVVRIAPTMLSYTDGQAWKDIYGFRPGKGQMRKDQFFYMLDKQDKLPAHIISTQSDADHTRYRRLLANAFSDQALRGQEEILNYYFRLLMKKLKEEVEGPRKGKIDMCGYYNFTTFDIIGDLTFGEPFYALEAGKYHPWIANIFKSVKYSRFLRIGGRYPILLWGMQTMSRLFPYIRRAREMHNSYTTERVARRLDTETDRKDFMTNILRHNDEKGMSRPEIIVNSAVLIVAGSETTATLLSGATYHLLQNPAKLARLQDEVRSAFSSLDEMTLVSTSKLPYLHAVVEESLRMYPPVPNILPRCTPPDGAIVAGQWVPGNTTLGVHQWSTYRDPANFAEPDSFAPERWLPDPPAMFAHDRKDALQPFSSGPRNCLGKNLAYNEMRSILARVIFAFDMELCPESQNWTDQPTFILWQKRPLMVQLRDVQEKA